MEQTPPLMTVRVVDMSTVPPTVEWLDPDNLPKAGLPPGLLCGGPRVPYLRAPASPDWESMPAARDLTPPLPPRELPGGDGGRLFRGGSGRLTWD